MLDSMRETILKCVLVNEATRIGTITYSLRGFGNMPMIAPYFATLAAKVKFSV
jgi:hypothetical protein